MDYSICEKMILSSLRETLKGGKREEASRTHIFVHFLTLKLFIFRSFNYLFIDILYCDISFEKKNYIVIYLLKISINVPKKINKYVTN